MECNMISIGPVIRTLIQLNKSMGSMQRRQNVNLFCIKLMNLPCIHPYVLRIRHGMDIYTCHDNSFSYNLYIGYMKRNWMRVKATWIFEPEFDHGEVFFIPHLMAFLLK